PIGRTKSSSLGTSKLWPYRISFSRNTIGFGSRIAALSRPLASAAEYGAITLSPGTWAYQVLNSWLCWAATRAAAPFGPRNTIGQPSWPPAMYRVLAAELMMWSIACMAKFQVMNSTIGRNPANAAPTPTPVKPYSVIGVSITRFAPNSSSRPWLTLYAPWYSPTSSDRQSVV